MQTLRRDDLDARFPGLLDADRRRRAGPPLSGVWQRPLPQTPDGRAYITTSRRMRLEVTKGLRMGALPHTLWKRTAGLRWLSASRCRSLAGVPQMP